MEGRSAETFGRAGRPDAPEPQEVTQAKLDAFLDHASTAVAVYRAENDGEDFVFVDFNRAAERIERIKKADLVGKSVLEVFPGVRDFGLFDVFQKVWKTGEPQRHPISVYKDERITGWRQNYVCKLPNGHVMAVYDDVTLSKRSEMAARMSEQCFRAIANYTYDWEVWVGPAGRVLWTNPAVMRVTGYSIKELTTMRDYPAPLVHADDRDRICRAFQSAVKGSSGNDVQFRIERKDGRVIWVEMSWQPLYDEDRHSLGHRESIRDVTARKTAEQALRQAEREKETILDSLSEHVVHEAPDMKVLWANRAACESLGLSREEVIGAYCYTLWADREDPCKDCPVLQAIKTGCRAEVEKTTSDGRVWFIQAAPVRDEDGAVVGGVEITLEITKYKRVEEELRKVRQECRLLREELESRQ